MKIWRSFKLTFGQAREAKGIVRHNDGCSSDEEVRDRKWWNKEMVEV